MGKKALKKPKKIGFFLLHILDLHLADCIKLIATPRAANSYIPLSGRDTNLLLALWAVVIAVHRSIFPVAVPFLLIVCIRSLLLLFAKIPPVEDSIANLQIFLIFLLSFVYVSGKHPCKHQHETQYTNIVNNAYSCNSSKNLYYQ